MVHPSAGSGCILLGLVGRCCGTQITLLLRLMLRSVVVLWVVEALWWLGNLVRTALDGVA